MTGAETLALVPAVIGALIGWWLTKIPDRQPNRLAEVVPAEAEPESVIMITPALRAELDQTPQWWTERFHQVLAAIAAPSVVEDTYEVIAYSGDTVLAWEDRGYRDCPCSNCRRICR